MTRQIRLGKRAGTLSRRSRGRRLALGQPAARSNPDPHQTRQPPQTPQTIWSGLIRSLRHAKWPARTCPARRDAQQKLVDASAASYRLSEARYQKGVDSYLSALDAQRSLYAARQSLVSLKLEAATNAVTLYKVLGGGDLALHY